MVTIRAIKLLFLCVLVASHASIHAYEARAQSTVQSYVTSPKANHYRDKVNQGTVGIISGGITGTYIRMATDLAAVLDDNDSSLLRILPISGKGGVSNIRDLLYLKGIDIAIVQSDILSYIEKHNIFDNIRRRVHYITQLYNAELHIVTRTNVKKISDLHGKKINFWNKGSATHITAAAVLEAYGVNVKPIYVDQSEGLELLKKGEIAANILLVGKPSRAFKLIRKTDDLHLLPIDYNAQLANTYLPSRFTHKDYPGLVDKGDEVQTIASAAVLAVYNWPKNHPRRKKVDRFLDHFFSNFHKFHEKGRHKKWSEVNLNTRIPGWKRYTYVTKKISRPTSSSEDPIEMKFKEFLEQRRLGSGRLSDQQKEELFDTFIKWRSKGN